MPVYIYICPKCSNEMQAEISYSERLPNEMPKCTLCGAEMIRSWNDTPVYFVGTGFYKNDSKKET